MVEAIPAVRKRILIVDDHPLMRDGLTEMIDGEPDLCVCGQAGDAEEGLNLATATNPDIAIIDIMMAGRNGLELIKELHTRLPRVAILALSMHDELLYAERVLRAGGRGYLMKEESGERVVAALRQILAGGVAVSNKVMLKMFCRNGGTVEKLAIDTLSDRELEVFKLIGGGRNNADIGDQLKISPKTVEVYRTRIREKLGLESAAKLIAAAARWLQ
jgi:DNA-binding NarL/FixJ family response regulator